MEYVLSIVDHDVSRHRGLENLSLRSKDLHIARATNLHKLYRVMATVCALGLQAMNGLPQETSFY